MPIQLHKDVIAGELEYHHHFFYAHLYSYCNFDTNTTTPILNKKICEDLNITKNWLNTLLRELESFGYIKRIYPKGKKRSEYVQVKLLEGK